MDIFMMVLKWTWNLFTTLAFPITYQGVTYNITFVGMLIFTTIIATAAWLIFSAFE